MSVKKVLFRCCAVLSSLIVLPCSSINPLSDFQSLGLNAAQSVKRAISNQTDLWINADSIDDGGVYFIRNAGNSNLVWDVPNSNYNDGTAPILYGSNGWGNQRFVVHKQAKYGDDIYYTITPLGSPNSTLRLNSNSENETMKLGNDNNSSLEGFLSNKFFIKKSNYGYTISTGVSTFGKYIIPKDGSVSSNNTLVQKTVSNATSNRNYQWLFCKTDTLGNDLKNKIYINGTNTQYFNLTPPSTGEFIIETEKYGSTNIDTYLELYNQNNDKRLAYNDDIGGTSNRYSRITYNFTDLTDVKVRVRGYSSNDVGYVYLTLRPKNALYFAGVYDYDKNNNDRPGSLNNVKPYFPNYYIEVQGNRGKSAILETAANGKKKINCEYFVFSGHGYSNAAGVEFYNGTASESFMYYEIPDLTGTKIAVWMTCHGARNYFKNNVDLTSMAYESVKKGADYSLGYVGTIYDTTQRAFPENFFEALNNGMTIPDAVNQATEWVKGDNWWYWTFFGQFSDDFKNPILYEKGDALKSNCGSGSYDDDKNKSKKENILESASNHRVYVDNTTNNESQNSVIELSEFSSTKATNNNSYNPQYVFKTNYLGREIELGFDCDSETGHVTYYNLTSNSIISSSEFETMMGDPSESVLFSIAQ